MDKVIKKYLRNCKNIFRFVGKMKKFFVSIGVILINALSLICYLEYKTIEEAKEQN